MKQVLLSWSSGKDAAWSLHILRQDPDVEVVGLLTTFNAAANRVAMHAVRREIVDAQAAAAGLPLWPVHIPSLCPNEIYEREMRVALERARADGITHVAFGDLFLEDVRRYREERMAGTGIDPLFPLWGIPTDVLAGQMIDGGLEATLTCVDPRQIAPRFVGRRWDRALVDELSRTTSLKGGPVDVCGERGEFHSCVTAGPMFRTPIATTLGERLERDGFWFCDVLPETGHLTR
jgi:uncharacterized protein (TIGR00290 family)